MAEQYYYMQKLFNASELAMDQKSTFCPYGLDWIKIEGQPNTQIVLNNQEFFIGQTGILELENVIITQLQIGHSNKSIIHEFTFKTTKEISHLEIENPEPNESGWIPVSEVTETTITTTYNYSITTPSYGSSDTLYISYRALENNQIRFETINLSNSSNTSSSSQTIVDETPSGDGNEGEGVEEPSNNIR